MGFLDALNSLAANGALQIGGSRQAGVNRPTVKPGANAPSLGSQMIGGSRRAGLTPGVNAAANQRVPVAAHTRNPPGWQPPPPPSGDSAPQDPQSIVDASLAGLRAQLQGDYNAHVTQGTAALVNASKVLLGMLQGIPAQTQSDYNNMLAQQTTLGQVGSAGLAAANPNPQLQADLQAVGAPSAQQTQLAGQMNNVFNGGAATLLGKTAVIPGEQISTDELAALTHARTLPSIAALQAMQEISKFVGAQNTGLQDKLFQVNQTRPGLINSANAAAATQAQNKFNNQFKIDQLNSANQNKTNQLNSNNKLKTAQLNATSAQNKQNNQFKVAQQNSLNFYRQAMLGNAMKRDAVAQWATEKRIGLAAQNQTFEQWRKTQGLKFEGQKVAISQQNANTAAARAARATSAGAVDVPGLPKGTSSAALRAYSKQAGSIAKSAFQGTPTTQYQWQTRHKAVTDPVTGKKNDVATQVQVPVHGTTHLSYQEAMRNGLAAGIPLVTMQKALNQYWSSPGHTAPWEKPGQGRPTLDYQQRQAAAGKGSAAQGAAYTGGPLQGNQLASLWVQAGGDPRLASTMAAIAQAESSGNPGSTNPTDNNGRQTSWGLWQISNGDHSEPPGWNTPLGNAKLAVGKMRSQGLGAWGTYTSGAYRRYLS